MVFSSWLRYWISAIERMKRNALTLAVLSLLLSGEIGETQGGPIHAEAYAQISEVFDNQYVNGYDPATLDKMGETYASASLTAPNPFASVTATAQADPSKLVGVTVAAALANDNFTSPPTWGSLVTGIATWSDTLMVSSSSGPMNSLVRLYFEVEGKIPPTVGAPVFGDPDTLGYFAVDMHASNEAGTDSEVEFSVYEGLVTVDKLSNYDYLSITPNSFQVIYHLDLSPLSIQDPQMPFFDQLAVVYSPPNGQPNSGPGSGLDPLTMSLPSVVLADGNTPESEGYSLTFGSGMASPNLSAVPEPSTVTLLGFGGLCSLGYGWRRRKLALAA